MSVQEHGAAPVEPIDVGDVATEEVPALQTVGGHSVDDVLASIETKAAQRPIAAQIVALTDSEHTGAREVARLLSADPALSGRVLKLANSAFYGMRGRVSSLQFAITVVGFSVVRSMATVALTGTEERAGLPPDFWTVSTHLALSASVLAPRMGQRPPDALCVGLLAQLGVALLHHHDPDGYAEVRAAGATPTARRQAEVALYGVDTLELTAIAMQRWGFPDALATPLIEPDDVDSAAGGLLRGALELPAADRTRALRGADRVADLQAGAGDRRGTEAGPGADRVRRAAPGARRLTAQPRPPSPDRPALTAQP